MALTIHQNAIVLGSQEFLASRTASHPVKTCLPNCQNTLLTAFDLRNTLNEDVLVKCYFESGGVFWLKACPKL